jgi:hypothetical protein
MGVLKPDEALGLQTLVTGRNPCCYSSVNSNGKEVITKQTAVMLGSYCQQSFVRLSKSDSFKSLARLCGTRPKWVAKAEPPCYSTG